MNTILLQKILDLLKDNLTGVGTFIKSVFVHDPQDNQILTYDAEIGKWVNKDATEVELDLTNTFEAQAVATITDGAENVPIKSLVVDIVPKQASGTPTPSNPLPISGSDEVVITHTYGDNITETKTIALPSTVYGGEVDVVSGQGESKKQKVTLGSGTRVTVANSNYIKSDACDAYITNANIYPNKWATVQADQICNRLTMAKNTIWSLTGYPNTFAISNTQIHLNISNEELGITDYTQETTTSVKAKIESWLANNPIELTIPVAPTPITTTPTQIKTKGGTENIFADCGDVEGEYYTKTSESVIALANITEDITSSITKNTTDFSDILFKASRNNKVVSIEIYSASTSNALIGTFLSNLPKPVMNCKVLLANTTLGEDGIIIGTLKTTGELEITTTGAKTFSGLITYVSK